VSLSPSTSGSFIHLSFFESKLFTEGDLYEEGLATVLNGLYRNFH